MERMKRERAGEPVNYDARTGDRICFGGCRYAVTGTTPDRVTCRPTGGHDQATGDEVSYTYEGLKKAGAVFADYKLRPWSQDTFVPEHTFYALDRYIFSGGGPSDFLYSVLTNNLKKAVEHADSSNREALVTIVMYLLNRVPSTAWGDEDTVSRWLDDTQNVRTRTVRTFY